MYISVSLMVNVCFCNNSSFPAKSDIFLSHSEQLPAMGWNTLGYCGQAAKRFWLKILGPLAIPFKSSVLRPSCVGFTMRRSEIRFQVSAFLCGVLPVLPCAPLSDTSIKINMRCKSTETFDSWIDKSFKVKFSWAVKWISGSSWKVTRKPNIPNLSCNSNCNK